MPSDNWRTGGGVHMDMWFEGTCFRYCVGKPNKSRQVKSIYKFQFSGSKVFEAFVFGIGLATNIVALFAMKRCPLLSRIKMET